MKYQYVLVGDLFSKKMVVCILCTTVKNDDDFHQSIECPRTYALSDLT